MEKDIWKETWVLNYVISRQPCTMPSSNSILMACFVTVKGVVVYRKLRSGMTMEWDASMSSDKKMWAALRVKGTRISLSTSVRCWGTEFGLKSSVEATPDTWDGKKQSGLCQTTSPLDSLAQWKKVSFSDDSIMHKFIPRKRHIRWPVGKRLDEWELYSSHKETAAKWDDSGCHVMFWCVFYSA